eukprot:CAMPEP_0185031500 /NCGR_PEP_ID=MMETSP1103-20130426/19009_1 /TAXON_ID=36769 /ORGANISM="Paraphysomonas bandaiensis, Strain Caron Lab Isolate" /LENGTH=548 /DNA_ID=CAMNT_0027567043 /DNA_START=103 /DNA_END=1749 /DNA_ORIENTATION=+
MAITEARLYKNTQSYHQRRAADESLSSKLEAAIVSIREPLSLIYHRYEYNTDVGRLFLLMQANMRESDWDILKYKFATKILTPGSKYKMIFGGSSVTAGHDNLYNQSYPLVFEKRLRSTFEKLGVEFEVRNIAQGANDCMPSNLCYESMGGYDGDFFGWEQSFNCGRDPSFAETVAYLAGVNRASFYQPSSGSWVPSACNMSEYSIPYSSEDWTPSVVGLEPFAPSAAEIQSLKKQMVDMHALTPSGAGPLQNLYKSVSISGMHIWTNYPKSICSFNPQLFSKECAVTAIYSKCAIKFLRKEGAKFGLGGGAKHHPTASIHMLRGELLVWLYGLPLLDALYMVQGDLKGGSTVNTLREKYTASLNTLQNNGELPAPKTCQKDPVACTHRAYCYTEYAPHYTNQTLQSLVVGSTKWILNNGPTPTMSVKQKRPRSDYETRAAYTSSGPEAGEIYFKVTIPSDRNVATVCAYKMKDAVKEMEFRVDLNVDAKNIVEYQPSSERKVWTAIEFFRNTDCVELKDFPPGNHVIGIEAKTKKPAVGVTHVITWQ